MSDDVPMRPDDEENPIIPRYTYHYLSWKFLFREILELPYTFIPIKEHDKSL